MGEPGGVAGEITVAAWRALHKDGPAFFTIADPERLNHLGATVETIETPAEADACFRRALPVLPVGAPVISIPGKADPRYAPLVIQSIERAVAFALSHAARAVVTNPIQKSSLVAAGFRFPGHTEFLGDLAKSSPMPNGRRRGPVMMIASDALKVVPVTVHTPLRTVPDILTTDTIVAAGEVTLDALKADFGLAAPRLAVAGLNPHAGEAGVLGEEDERVVRPAVEALRAAGHDVAGPLPADTMFHEEARASYDAALCMYHDQALIPAKTLAFHDGVNVTLGLPFVRTSPDHGTALAIAGKGLARPDSLIAAIRLAELMSAAR